MELSIKPYSWISRNVVHKGYRTNEVDSKKIDFFVSSWLVTLVCTIAYYGVLWFIQYWAGVYILTGYMVSHGIICFMLTRHTSLKFIGNYFALTSLIGFSLFAMTSGGISSPIVTWFICTQVVAFWYAGKKAGLFWSIMCIVAVFSIFIAETLGVNFPLMFPEKNNYILSGVMHTGVTIYYLIVIITYEGWTNAAVKAENEKKNELQQRQQELLLLNQELNNSNSSLESALKQIKSEKQKSEKLLLNILPSEIAEELKEKGQTEARQFDAVSVLFTDFVHFTQTSEKLTPTQIVEELNECFTAFDNIIEHNGLEKIKTIGDAYMAVCGLPHSDPRHAQRAVQAALEIRDYIAERKQRDEGVFEIRIGVNSGSVIAGIVGVKKFAYDIWGDTVNTASRMESSGEPGKVNISETTYQLIKNEFNCAPRGKINAKGKGEVEMYFVNGQCCEAVPRTK